MVLLILLLCNYSYKYQNSYKYYHKCSYKYKNQIFFSQFFFSATRFSFSRSKLILAIFSVPLFLWKKKQYLRDTIFSKCDFRVC